MVVPTEFKLASADPDSSVRPQANRIESEAVNARPQDIRSDRQQRRDWCCSCLRDTHLGSDTRPGGLGRFGVRSIDSLYYLMYAIHNGLPEGPVLDLSG